MKKHGINDINWTLFSWKSSLEKLNLKADICFFGDSITRGGDFQNCFPDKVVCNLGISGDNLSGMLERVDMIRFVSPKEIYLMAGINDLLAGNTSKVCIDKYHDLIKAICSQNPQARLFVQSVLPINNEKCKKNMSAQLIRDFNKSLEKICKEESVEYIDVFSLYEKDGKLPEEYTVDGLHLYPQAYSIWMNKLQSYIKKG